MFRRILKALLIAGALLVLLIVGVWIALQPPILIEQRLRDVIGWQIGDGTPQIQKLILARLIFGKGYGER